MLEPDSGESRAEEKEMERRSVNPEEIRKPGTRGHLDKMIECLEERDIQRKEISGLSDKADALFSNLDRSIQRCKKYNEAKVNLKYQMIIKDLRDEIKELTQKLKLEQDARSPTKKHVSDILDKLVQYREENQHIRNENASLQKELSGLKSQMQLNISALLRLQGIQRNAPQRLPALSSTTSVDEAVQAFLKDKEKQRVKFRGETSAFETMLTDLRPKLWQFNICDLLSRIDKWSDGLVQPPSVDMWKIRANIARKFSSYIDDSNMLLTPTESALSPTQSALPSIMKKSLDRHYQASNPRSRRSLNSSIQ